MKTYAKYDEVTLAAIEPGGWLRVYLEKQARGLTGHIEAAGFPFDRPVWSGPARAKDYNNSWWAFEQVGYWVDGAIRCGYLLGDRELIAKARRHIDYTFDHPVGNVYLGPAYLRAGENIGGNETGKDMRWPHAVFFRAARAHYEMTGDRRVIKRLVRHYLGDEYDYGAKAERDICNIETELWLYKITGDRRLLRKALAEYRRFDAHPECDCNTAGMLSGKPPSTHGVTFNEECKLAAIAYIYGGNRRYLKAAVNAYAKVQKHHMLVDGIHSSAEHFEGRGDLASHETCDIADFMWSNGYLLMATGNPVYADRIELAAFNAAPGAVKDDFRGLQYFSCPNQVVATSTSNHNRFMNGFGWMSYRPKPGTECCTGEVSRIMPNYCARMWMTDRAGDPCAMLYGPSTFKIRAGADGNEVEIRQETNYPFGESVDFSIRCARDTRFAVGLRIPGWCRGARVLLNGARLGIACRPGTVVKIRRVFRNNDRITLLLPMSLKTTRWPGGGIAVERGPLVYALKIAEKWTVDGDDPRQTPEFPAWNLMPASDWNYALDLDGRGLEEQIEVVRRPAGADPWTFEGAPIELRAPARRVRGWKTRRCRRQLYKNPPWQKWIPPGPFVFTPPLPDPKNLKDRLSRRPERITLIPYGCTHLRLTVFPKTQPR